MARTEHGANQQVVSASWLTPRRIGLGALAVVAVLVSPILVVYEFVVGLALVGGGFIARLIQRSPTERNVRAVGLALLAGPVAYALAWFPAQLFNW
ncbi:MAG: hypothetical protein ACRDJB_10990 [Actinomycetota bacterium]